MKITILFLIMLIFVPPAMGETINGGTLFIVDTSGSGNGQGVSSATDSDELRAKALSGVLRQRALGAGRLAMVAVITCGERPEILLPPTHDQSAIDDFLKKLRPDASGKTPLEPMLALLPSIAGRPDHIIYIGDGLLTRVGQSSSQVVQSLATSLDKLYGQAPRIHIIAIDSSGKVFPRTEAAWVEIASSRVVEVRTAADVTRAVRITARNLGWTRPAIQPKQPVRRWPFITAAVVLSSLLLLAALKLRRRGSALNAQITIEENGRSRRTSARTFGKPEVSIGDGGCDVKVPKWEKPITLLEREVVDRRGRKRRQTIARHGNRSVILGAIPVSFSNGTTTVRLRGGRR